MPDYDTRIAAYGVVIRDEQVLLARYLSPHGREWTLPGGGLEFGEHPEEAAVREIREETGFDVRLDRLLGLDSLQVGPEDRHSGRTLPLHAVRVIYRASVVGGTLTPEADGSTDEARWVPLDEVDRLVRVPLVDVGLTLWSRG